MHERRVLVVNADDFGLSAGVNRGIIEAHERGIVTSTSLMVRWAAAGDAARYSQEHPKLSFGLHVDLGEWIVHNGAWTAIYDVVSIDDPLAVAEEISAQVTTFRRVIDRNPTHLDSHQHVHLRDPVRTQMSEAARQLGVPLRHEGNNKIKYCGDFYGQTTDGQPLPDGVSAERLLAILGSLPCGITEMACHPGYADELNTMYRNERSQEVATLCDPRVRRAIESLGIQLRSFGDLMIGGSNTAWY